MNTNQRLTIRINRHHRANFRKGYTPAPRTQIDCDSADTYIDDSEYLCSNNVDPDFDIDSSAEFDDSDGYGHFLLDTEDLRGLTIVEPDSVLDTVCFLNGYHI